ncbi:MAG: ABC transporter substrate-binding protein [Microcoleus sp. PH2017_10_PVI_O_A]|uniref:ABC transporter substrate-binding protein n=1 Tax=unclassified Microcoleus TaxID=2642155 RepID=UPI001D43049A|nr:MULTISPECIES: ABC transporter substrate-binding protein [unclassified Microcoleus]TAE81625.1 MAG: nitrate ABC transporter substrate-binding protein [Oscillatoriales cyanobacterium]MCC3407085.1 ABC transporter substrate-binding protein [Microcoleus sp. PH2017_10_PVI_O_A]MCC3461095.1 ABC transporter substrate-binding protein [Microcoleus sp. PH2017_11_PCY_U_A]MCC3479612.1 ABC transporter substrate-binding protein [Microcoleus sp. PH2017_12_PCY_D_A]MCC3529716.1 ABC transporter substrate-bindin
MKTHLSFSKFILQVFGAVRLVRYLPFPNREKAIQKLAAQKLKFAIKPSFFSLFAIALTLIFALNACSFGPKQSLKPLRVGITSWAGFDVVLYAQASELFKQRGIKVELVRFDNQQDSSRAVMNNRLDAAFISVWDAMQVEPGDGLPVVLMTTNISAGSDGIVAKPEIKSVEDLRGKRVGAKLGTVNHLILLEALKAHKITPVDVHILDYSNEVAAEKITSEDIDAAILWNPMLGETAKTIKGNVIYTTKQVDSLVIDILMSNDKTVKAKQAELTQFILAWFDVMHAVETKQNQVFEVVAKKLGQSAESFASDYAGLKKGDIALNRRMFQTNGRLSSVKTQIIQLLEEDPRHGRVIRQDVKIDGSLVSKAIEAWKS